MKAILSLILLLTAIFTYQGNTDRKSFSRISWKHQIIDSNRTVYDLQDGKGIKKWFGFALGDLTGDGFPDVLAGKWLYENPGRGRSEHNHTEWKRSVIGDTLDAMGVADVDANGSPDVLAVRCNEQYYLSQMSVGWQRHQLATLPICNHLISSQGYMTIRLFRSGPAYWLLTDETGTIHALPLQVGGDRRAFTIAEATGDDKGIAVGDLTGDRHPDVVAGVKTASGWAVALFVSPGKPRSNWGQRIIGHCQFKPDRFVVSDLNGDHRDDVLVSEGRWPGKDPDARLYALFQQSDGQFRADTLLTQYSMNSLSVGDLDGDGDPDIVVGEHKGPLLRLQWGENDGRGRFSFYEIDRGQEHHLGCQLADLDADGDLDIVSAGWDKHSLVHIWYNQRN